MESEIKLAEQSRKSMIKALDLMSDYMGPTVGPLGSSVLIENYDDSITITQDGDLVLKNFEDADPFVNLWSRIIINASRETGKETGSGVSATFLLINTIVKELIRYIEAGWDWKKIRRELVEAADFCENYLKQLAKPVTNPDTYYRIARSYDWDTIGENIAKAFLLAFDGGSVSIEAGNATDTEIVNREGYWFGKGFLSPYFSTDTKDNIAKLEDAVVLVTDKSIDAVQEILPVLQQCAKAGKALLIIAEKINDVVLNTLVMNKTQGKLKVVAVQAPGIGDKKEALLEDIAIVTGGVLFSGKRGMELSKASIPLLGHAEQIVVSSTDTHLIDGGGNADLIRQRQDSILAQIEQTDSKYKKEDLQDRLARLSGHVVIVKMGGLTDLEIKNNVTKAEKILAILQSVRKAGIVAGGGTAYISLYKGLEAKGNVSTGASILKRALLEPANHIITNGNESAQVLMSGLLNTDLADYGYDVSKQQYVNMIETGIVDPVDSVCLAIKKAVSTAVMLINSSGMIVKKGIKP